MNPENSTALAKAISYFESCSNVTERGKSASLLKDLLLSKGLSFPLIDESWNGDVAKLIAGMNRFDFPGRIYSVKTRADEISRQRSLIHVSDATSFDSVSNTLSSDRYKRHKRSQLSPGNEERIFEVDAPCL